MKLPEGTHWFDGETMYHGIVEDSRNLQTTVREVEQLQERLQERMEVSSNLATAISGCPDCQGTAGREGCPQHRMLLPDHGITVIPNGITVIPMGPILVEQQLSQMQKKLDAIEDFVWQRFRVRL